MIIKDAVWIFSIVFNEIEPDGMPQLFGFIKREFGSQFLNALHKSINEKLYSNSIEWFLDKGRLDEVLKRIDTADNYAALSQDKQADIDGRRQRIYKFLQELKAANIEQSFGDVSSNTAAHPNHSDKLTGKQVLGGVMAFIGSVALGAIAFSDNNRNRK